MPGFWESLTRRGDPSTPLGSAGLLRRMALGAALGPEGVSRELVAETEPSEALKGYRTYQSLPEQDQKGFLDYLTEMSGAKRISPLDVAKFKSDEMYKQGLLGVARGKLGLAEKSLAEKQKNLTTKQQDFFTTRSAIENTLGNMESLLKQIPAGRVGGGVTQLAGLVTGRTPHAEDIAQYDAMQHLIAGQLARMSVGRVSQLEYLRILQKVMPQPWHSEKERASKFSGTRKVLQDELDAAMKMAQSSGDMNQVSPSSDLDEIEAEAAARGLGN